MESRKSFPIDVAVSVEPNASSKCLISLAVAVVGVVEGFTLMSPLSSKVLKRVQNLWARMMDPSSDKESAAARTALLELRLRFGVLRTCRRSRVGVQAELARPDFGL